MRTNFLLMTLMNEAGVDGAAAGGSNASAPSTTDSATSNGSVLGGAGQSIAINELIPEKFRVVGDDGNFNLEASARRLAESYSALERRAGSGDLPPRSVDEYSLEGALPEGLDPAEIMKDPTTQSFLKRCHAKGMTNVQVQEVLNFALTEWAPKLVEANGELAQEEAVSQLRDTWKSDQEFNHNLQSAYRAFMAYADSADRDQIDSIGNNPIVIRLLANIGREMSEDRPAGGLSAPGAGSQDALTLMQSEAYRNPNHPDHERVSRQVREIYERKYGTHPVL